MSIFFYFELKFTDLGLDASKTTLSDYILKSVLELISKEATDSNKYLAQYFQLFVMYVGYGVPEVSNFLAVSSYCI